MENGEAGSEEAIEAPKPARWMRRLAWGMLALVILAGLAGGGFYRYLIVWGGRPFGAKGKIALTINKGESIQQIAEGLEKAGLAERAFLFKAWIVASGEQHKIQAGNYQIKTPITPKDLLHDLGHGSFVRKFTIPEGWTGTQIGAGLVKAGWIKDAVDWSAVVAEPIEAEVFGEAIAEGAEGFCFPETYIFEADASPALIRAAMLRQFGEVWKGVNATERDARSAKLTTREVVTLASVIEREARREEEMPRIASVFLNRLTKGMKLQSCATVYAALGGAWDRPLTYEDLKIDSPYNTYKVKGLPAGPIGNPSRAALEAALRPAAEEFLYFVYQGDGRHAFSKSYKEHMKHAREHKKSDPTADKAEAEPGGTK